MKKTILLMIFYCSVQTLFAQNDINNTTEINNKSDILQMSSTNNSVVTYDFTTSASKYYGGAAGAAILEIVGTDTTWGMIAGDANGDGKIDYSEDILDTWAPNIGATGYQQADLDLNGDVGYSQDILVMWAPNFGKQTLVP